MIEAEKIWERISVKTEKKRLATHNYYVASRVKHADYWKSLRVKGARIISTWIDEAGVGETSDLSKLWENISYQIYKSNGLVMRLEPDDFPLKGALVEAGMAIAFRKPIRIYAPNVVIEDISYRPIGSWVKHPYVKFIDSIEKYLGVENG